MSEENEADTCCAFCGSAEIDDIKLKECATCDLVKYCSDACQKEHGPQHEEACKKRAAELRDELLFKQPESNHLGDCPICMIPLPYPMKYVVQTCCSKVICKGCSYANRMRDEEAARVLSCPFCRTPVPDTDKERKRNRMKRIEANDPFAIRREGRDQYDKGDYRSAVELYIKAAQLGDVDAHYNLSCMYRDGLGVEKDRGKEIYHLEEAAIGGHPDARFNLGCDEEDERGNIERAVRHFIISANLGDDGSIKLLIGYFKEGFVSKDDLAGALRAHQAALDATKSPQREAGEEYYRIEDNSNTEDC